MSNIRYVITCVSPVFPDMHTLVFPGQGRYTYATEAEATEVMELHREGLTKVIGNRINTLMVRPVECWPGHNDPKKTVW